MKYKIPISAILLIIINSCSNNTKLARYNNIIEKVDDIKINFNKSEKEIDLNDKEIDYLKTLLLKNIKPEFQRKFISDIQINLYNDKKLVGVLFISDIMNKPFINFNSNQLNFGFQMSYRLGMYLGEKNNYLKDTQ